MSKIIRSLADLPLPAGTTTPETKPAPPPAKAKPLTAAETAGRELVKRLEILRERLDLAGLPPKVARHIVAEALKRDPALKYFGSNFAAELAQTAREQFFLPSGAWTDPPKGEA